MADFVLVGQATMRQRASAAPSYRVMQTWHDLHVVCHGTHLHMYNEAERVDGTFVQRDAGAGRTWTPASFLAFLRHACCLGHTFVVGHLPSLVCAGSSATARPTPRPTAWPTGRQRVRAQPPSPTRHARGTRSRAAS